MRTILLKLMLATAVNAAGIAGLQSDGLASIGPDLSRAIHLAQGAGERLWPGYGNAPFGMLLIAGDKETLLCQPNPPQEFVSLGNDPATGCERRVRPRTALPDNLLAAMPIFGPASTIVIGTPENTGFSKPDWLRTILHEHFHQWQTSRPGYFSRVDRLDLKGGDETGMWLLNYPFPYDDPAVGSAYVAASTRLADALAARGTNDFPAAFDRYRAARRDFARAAGAKNWRYLEFELWQEGGARWTEYAIAKRDTDQTMKQAALTSEARTIARLRRAELKVERRKLVYTLGTAELMLMDACTHGWRKDYPSSTSLGPLLDGVRSRCGSTSH